VTRRMGDNVRGDECAGLSAAWRGGGITDRAVDTQFAQHPTQLVLHWGLGGTAGGGAG